MAVRNDFTAGEVLAAQDLNDTFGSRVPFAYGTATPSTTVDGFVWFDENETPPAPKFWDGAAFQSVGGGKILQVVRATDSTNRTTTSATFVDASISVTITPQKNDSAIVLLASLASISPGVTYSVYQITDSSNNAISGAEAQISGVNTAAELRTAVTLLGYSTPATLSATTYKVRFRSDGGGSVLAANASNTGSLYAIEVSA
jgi:hypothetical protein